MSAFPAIRIEGGLFGPETPDALFVGQLQGQKPADFGLGATRHLTDEIAAVFADARALWGVFQNRLARLPENDLATSVTRDAWMVPFLGLLGYELRYNPRAYDVDGLSFAISHRADEAEHTPPIHIVGARQKLGRVPGSGRPRMAPHSLLQEYLNRTEHLWGIVTNGLTLRLLRDTTFVRRQAYIEFDLAAIFDEQLFQDFSVLYRLLHRSRFPRGVDDSEECLLSRYFDQAVEQGGRVREGLRHGVKACIERFAAGFFADSENEALRRAVRASPDDPEHVSAGDVYRDLLILIYRFLFLLVSEDRGLLSSDSTYRQHYGVARLRRILESRAAWTDDNDLWQSLRVLWRVLADDKLASLLKLTPLNGELFAPLKLDCWTMSNRDLLDAFWHLAWYRETPSANERRVNYAALDVEELGSVYEALLDYHPRIDPSARPPKFELIEGSERKSTGSYYTPPQLVNELIQSALEPVIRERLTANPKNGAKALLSIRICDPACGSGHFLLAAARKLGKELARIRSDEEEPAPERVRDATREVISHCIYGVDRNPLAVDLCRVALWIESHTADKPLTFLDNRIRPGDSLVGVFDLAVLKDGIPDEAFKPLDGDDRELARETVRRNRQEKSGSRDLLSWEPEGALKEISAAGRALDAIGDDSPEAIRKKKRHYQEAHNDLRWQRQKQACDLWTAAFFQPLKPFEPVITTASVAECLDNKPPHPQLAGIALDYAVSQRFFHWPLEFPEVFTDGGFDVVLSNPPWERVKLQEQEFFAVRDPRIAMAPTKAVRAKLLKELARENPELHGKFVEALRGAFSISAFMRHSGRFPLTGRGDINTYAVFAEFAVSAIGAKGRAGLILPIGIATDDGTKFFFGALVNNRQLIELIGFENEDHIFPAVHHAQKFCALGVSGTGLPVGESRIAFYVRKFSQLNEEERFFYLSTSDFALLSPNTGNCPVFRRASDAELTKAIYRRVPVLWREGQGRMPDSNPWKLTFKTLFHMANDSHLFRTAEELQENGDRREGNVFVSPYDRHLPLYEAKMLHQFDHRFSTYDGASEKQISVGILPQPNASEKADTVFVVQPRYWVREEVVESAIPKFPEPLAIAVELGDPDSMRRVLVLWAAGFHFLHGDEIEAKELLRGTFNAEPLKEIARVLGTDGEQSIAQRLAADFPLSLSDVKRITEELKVPEPIAKELLERFSPKWLLGWRDITNATNERTMIASALPRTAVGHTCPLAFLPGIAAGARLVLCANLNSFVMDYAARQKVGGTHITYGLLKQFPVLPPDHLLVARRLAATSWISSRALELVYTAYDVLPLARDCGYGGPPFVWNDSRRFELRCELDAMFFHLYLPSTDKGDWKRACVADGAVVDETPEQLAELKRYFPSPRDAVSHILDQFPIVREKDEKAPNAVFRTKERILAMYDSMQTADLTRIPYRSAIEVVALS